MQERPLEQARLAVHVERPVARVTLSDKVTRDHRPVLVAAVIQAFDRERLRSV